MRSLRQAEAMRLSDTGKIKHIRTSNIFELNRRYNWIITSKEWKMKDM